MSTQVNNGPRPARAAEVCRFFSLGDEAKKNLTPEQTPEEFIQLLLEKRLEADAIQFIAHYLPKRQAVFWALSCVKETPEAVGPQVEAAVQATEKWIVDPSEENRKATMKAAEDADAGTPVGATALAAFYADGLPRTEDPKANARAYFLTAKLVAAAVLMAAASDLEKVKERLPAFAGKGAEVVKKTHR
jgi:hypothetical protein